LRRIREEGLIKEGAELTGGGGEVAAGGAQLEVIPSIQFRGRAQLAVAAARHPSSSWLHLIEFGRAMNQTLNSSWLIGDDLLYL
jgi:hypothetical protein